MRRVGMLKRAVYHFTLPLNINETQGRCGPLTEMHPEELTIDYKRTRIGITETILGRLT